ncbi:MAG: phosphate ABC transporter permease PstA [Acidimicrobiia bacterium]|nr:phosphate ABC transporter permease PstA [Acidimicrobiia bacterium]
MPRHTPAELVLMAVCALSSLLATWLLFARLTDGVGWLGFGLCWYGGFIGLLYACTREQDGPLVAMDRVVETVMTSVSLVLFVPFAFLLGYIVSKGLPALRPGFFIHDQSGVRATDPATAGGGAHAIVGSVEQVLLALAFTLPLSLLTATFLNETRSRWRRPVRILIDAMSGLPSIIAGLFIYAFFVIPYAKTTTLFNFNGFLACLALSITMLPTITRTVEVVLRLVPNGLREASLALGSSRARTVWSVVLPTARSGVTTAVVLGIARAVGETAPLLFTSFGLDLMNANPFSKPQESLPLFIFRNVQKPSEAAISRAFTAALVLMIVVLVLFAIARFFGRDRTASRARRTRRRAARRAATSPVEPTPLELS